MTSPFGASYPSLAESRRLSPSLSSFSGCGRMSIRTVTIQCQQVSTKKPRGLLIKEAMQGLE